MIANPSKMTVGNSICVLFAVFLVSRIIKLCASIKAVGTLPGMKVIAAPVSIVGSLLPTSRLNPGLAWQWNWRNRVYNYYGAETISVIPFLFGRPSLYTSSLEVARQVLSTKMPFEKCPDVTQFALMYGQNLFSVNGSEWRRHRRIMGPAFTQETYSLVWEHTALLYREMTAAEGWDGKASVVLPEVNGLTNKFSLIIISRCGFGNLIPWKSPPNAVDAMNYGEALEVVSETCIIRLLTPRWMYKLPIASLRKIEDAHITVIGLMKTLVNTQKKSLAEENSDSMPRRRDLASLMIRASESEGKLAMSDEELVGNTFFLLFAGHETMAHIWAATIGFIALYEDIQEEMVKEILAVAPGDTPLIFEDASKLDKVLACFLEAGRLFPAGFLLMRDSTEDVVLSTHDGQLAVERGVRVCVDMVGLHHNPRHFPEPEEFRPSRWYGAHENDLSMFSVGPRACIGRKFALTEACCFLAHLLREWKLEIILLPCETRPQWRERVMKGETKMTLGVGSVPVRLVRRP